MVIPNRSSFWSICLLRHLLVLTCCVWLLFGSEKSGAVDLIVHGGEIITVDANSTIAEAMAVTGDRITAVGSDSQIQKMATSDTVLVNLAGATVIPGLVDSHVHATGASVYEFDHTVPDVRTLAEALEYIRGRTKTVPKGSWIRVQQIFVTRLEERRFPTRNELDSVAPDHPVIYRTGPDIAVNSLALAMSGIDASYQLPSQSTGRLERDEDGRLNGIIRGARDIIRYEESQREPTRLERSELLAQLLRDYNSVGITSISDRNVGNDTIETYRDVERADLLSCRVFLFYRIDPDQPLAAIREKIAALRRDPLHTYNNRLWLRGIKIFLDGGMLTGSAYMRQPWGVSSIYSIRDPEYRGTLKVSAEQMYQIARLAMQHDMQITAHAVGDGAVHHLIDAYEAVNRDLPIRVHRPCITHANFMSQEAIDKMASLGIVADLQPAWLYLDGATLLQQFGDDRLQFFQPYKTLFECGVTVGGGSDHMQKIGSLRSINPYNPFLGMWITLTRMPRGRNEPLHPEQRILREQALRLYTINNAYLSFEEDEKGSLEPGKLADFVVLDRNVLTCPIDDIPQTRVQRTFLGGKQVYLWNESK